MNKPVKPKPPRTRRAERARETGRRIVETASRLFLERGYVPTTIEAIAEEADVAVETVYARFRNKRTILMAVLDHAITEAGAVPLDRRPELEEIAAEPERRRQIQRAARLSRGMLERTSPAYALLLDAARSDRSLRVQLDQQVAARRRFQRTLVELLQRTGPLRPGLSIAGAADTYSALANPELFLLLTEHHGWTAAKYERWLADSLERLLF